MGRSETFVQTLKNQTLKNNDVRFITYVPDNVPTPLIKGVTSDKALGTSRGGVLDA